MKLRLRITGLVLAIGWVGVLPVAAQWAAGGSQGYGTPYPSTGYGVTYGSTPVGQAASGFGTSAPAYGATTGYPATGVGGGYGYGTGGYPYSGGGYPSANVPASGGMPSYSPTQGAPQTGAVPNYGTGVANGHMGGMTNPAMGMSGVTSADQTGNYSGEMVAAPQGNAMQAGSVYGPSTGVVGPASGVYGTPAGGAPPYGGGMAPGIGGSMMHQGPPMGGVPPNGGFGPPMGSGDVFVGDCGPICDGPVVMGPAAPKWFGGVYGLIMDRDDGNQQHYLVDPTVADRVYLSSRDAEMEFSGGYELRLGRVFGCGSWGLEYVYWELFPDDQTAIVTLPGVPAAALSGTIRYDDVFLPHTVAADSAYNLYTNGNIYSARLRRDFDFQNIEINLLSGPLVGCQRGRGGCGGCGVGGLGYGGFRASRTPAFGPGPAGGFACGAQACNCAPPRLQVGWLFGVRYFRFDETWLLSYDSVDAVYDGANPDTEFHHFVAVDNDLVGAQLGLNLDYCLGRGLQLEAGTKFGLYGNHSRHRQRIYNGLGNGYILPTAPQDVDIQSDDTDIAFLGELRAGVAYKVGCHWRLTGGYRAVAVSGVALATNQLPFGRSYTDLAGVANVDRNGHLLLHGAYAGAEFAW